MAIKMLDELRRGMGEQSENFNKKIEHIRFQTEVTELRNKIMVLK